MDIRQFDSVTNASAGMRLVLIDPVTKQDKGAGLILFGADSSVHKQARKEIDARNRAAGRAPTQEELTDQTAELLARCTRGWWGLEEGREDIPFSQEKAKQIYLAYPEIAERAATFIFTRANFFGTASAS